MNFSFFYSEEFIIKTEKCFDTIVSDLSNMMVCTIFCRIYITEFLSKLRFCISHPSSRWDNANELKTQQNQIFFMVKVPVIGRIHHQSQALNEKEKGAK